jgi:hypothetical protein
MGLLHPGWLLLGLGIAVPLVLHLFQRHQGPRMVFPALRYLRRAEKESARKVRLRQLLLMLLRVLAVLLIAFAAARPFIRAAGIGHEPAAVVIILDNSMSSGAVSKDQRVLDVLKARALETLAAAEPEDAFWLLRAGSPDEPALPGDAVETARRVRETEPGDAAADIGGALARARSILAAGAQKRAAEIQLLSDLQATNFTTALHATSGSPALVVWSPSDEAPANRAISDVIVGGGFAPGANERSTVTAVVSGNTTDSANLRLVIDGRLAGATRATGAGSAVMQLPARPAGVVSGVVEMDVDALRADNRRFFATRVAEPPLVAVSAALPFIDEALDVLQSAGRIKRISYATSGSAAVVLLPGGGSGSVLTGRATAVVLPPETPLEIQAVNRRLAASGIPWRYALQQAPGEARFQMRDSTDSVLRTLEGARLRNVYALTPSGRAAGDSVLLRLRDGAPWAVRGTRAGGGRYVLIASPLTESASSIPTSAAMLPLLDRIIRTWAAAEGGTEEAQPGDEITLPSGATAVERPDSTTEPVTAGTYRVPARAGIYHIMSGTTVLDAFAVNVPAIESDLTRISSKSLRTLLPSWRITDAHGADEWKSSIYRARVGRELWRTLLAALLVVLALEALIATHGLIQRRADRASTSSLDNGAARAPGGVA